MALACEECMKGAPYAFCCKRECGEHEFCRNCSYISNNKYCSYKTEQMLQYSKEELNNKPADFYNSIKPIPIDWSTVKPLPPVTDGSEDYLIPVERVLDDMYSDSCIASSAKEYYINNYATEQEKEEFKIQETISNFISILSLIIFLCCFVIFIINFIIRR
jgi:hypothetical protein